MKRRLMIARALMHEPRLLILDEPTAGVDIEIRRSMWEFLRNINDAGHDHHPDHALPGGSRKSVPQYRHHRRRQHHRARQHGECAAQAADRSVRLQFARAAAAAAPQMSGFTPVLSDDHTLEIEMSKTQSLNDIFAQLSAQGIAVNSMRNKVNRLEELFIRLVDGNARDRRRQGIVSMAESRLGHRLDRFHNHRHSRIQPHRAHLGPDPRATGGHRHPVLRHLRQPDRAARRPGGRLRLHAVHGARHHHDERDSDFLRQCGVVVLRREIRQAHRGAAGVAAAELADRRGLYHGRRAARRAGGLGGDHHFVVLHALGDHACAGHPLGGFSYQLHLRARRVDQRFVREEFRPDFLVPDLRAAAAHLSWAAYFIR